MGYCCNKLRGMFVFNLRFLLSPGSCGWFCIRYITKKRIRMDFYLSLYAVKEKLMKLGYYCSCVKIIDIRFVKEECLTLVKRGKSGLHYIVVKKICGDYIYYYDPLFVFVVKRKLDVFLRNWSNVCLLYKKI